VALVEKNKSTIVREKLMMETLVKLAMRNTSLIPQTKVKMVAQKKGKTRTNVDGG